MGGGGEAQVKAIEGLAARHADDPRVGKVARSLARSYATAAETLLRAIVDKSEDREARGQAVMALGQMMKSRAEFIRNIKDNPGRVEQIRPMMAQMGLDGPAFDALLKTDPEALLGEAEGYFERVAKDYGDIDGLRGTLGKLAESELYEIRNLGIGRMCPEIAGEDIDGVAFKLSDYRGKVVVVDFWGDW
jgi:hypothetical protein